MNHRSVILFLVTLPTAVVLAQTQPQDTSTDSTTAMARARCQYVVDEGWPLASARNGEIATTAPDPQFPRPMPRPGYPHPRLHRPMGYPQAYPQPAYWTNEVSPRHAVIGAIVGFGFGALAGARSSTADAFRVGGIFAGVGGLIGLLTPEHRYYPPPYDKDDDEEASGSTHGRATSASKTETERKDWPIPVGTSQ